MRVWRLEDKEGKGPYTGILDKLGGLEAAREFYRALFGPDGSFGSVQRPHPRTDHQLREHAWKHEGTDIDHFLFGFRSKAQMAAWFPKKAQKRLAGYGFTPHLYSVPKEYVVLGNKQLTFDRRKATKLSKEGPDALAKAA